MTRLRPISWLLQGLTAARWPQKDRTVSTNSRPPSTILASSRSSALSLCGVRRSFAVGQTVAIGRRAGQAAWAQRVIIRRGAFGNSVKQLQQRIGTFKQSPSLPNAYLPFNEGDGKGIGHARGPDPLAWCGIPLPLFTSAKGTRAGPQAPPAASDYFSPHSRISFHRYSSAVRPARMAVSCASV